MSRQAGHLDPSSMKVSSGSWMLCFQGLVPSPSPRYVWADSSLDAVSKVQASVVISQTLMFSLT